MTWNPKYILACATIALVACDVAPEKSFKFDLTRANGVDVEAHDVNGPLRGVVVSIRAQAPDAGQTGELLWMGATASDGHARALIRTDRAGDALDITLHKAGWHGPWTDDALRAQQGITAPSARLVVPIARAQTLEVSLERSE